MLMHSFELFKMLPNESIVDMDMQLSSIFNSLEALGKYFTTQEKVQKILRSLPPDWDAKVTAIQEAKDLSILKMEELLGSLMVYESNIKAREIEKASSKSKSIALEAETHLSSESDEDINLLSRKFKKFLKTKKNKK